MAEELQQLIDRIRSEGVEKADREAEERLERARREAEETVGEARSKAEQIISDARREAAQYEQRSRQSLRQAARDLLLTVGGGVEHVVRTVLRERVGAGFDEEVMADMLRRIAESGDQPLEVYLNEDDRERLSRHLAADAWAKVREGVELRTDHELLKGFRVSARDGDVRRDFTETEIVESLSAFLRPHLQELVNEAVKESLSGGDGASGAQGPAGDDG
ncbi:hypothetical protein [Kiritimatiella glycovorans]|uniref:V-type ATP synthase subunit E n=1 Tax=Kiritimatiella glycovorans TaxID=1307763 RepID=A0A0G3EI88_9BACT|nr:hypothetical protein [Kiritimatiella glycovorans]AKJ64530.1 V-type ATP synthase subunit E [Kiritimatiella glycovorans]